MIKNILIDVDGTMVDTEHAFYASLNDALEVYKLPAATDKTLFGMSVDQALRKLCIEDMSGIKELWEDLFNQYCSKLKLYDHIKEMMETLSAAGILFVIITSRGHSTADVIWLDSEVSPYVKGCIAAEDTVLHKPDPSPLYKAIERYDLTADETIYIGDTIQDYQAAAAAGITFALAGWNVNAENNNYPIVFTEPMQVIKYVEGVRG